MAKKTIKRLCIFAHYDPDNLIDKYVVLYIKSLSKLFSIIFVSDCSSINKKDLNKIKNYTIKRIVKHHGEYDFGSYKRGYLYAKKNQLLKKYDWLLFANDSCYGPFYKIDNFIKKQDNLINTVYGMTLNTKTETVHIESFFIALPKNIFLKKDIISFFKGVKKEYDKNTIVEKYEYGLAEIINKYKPKLNSFFDDPKFTLDPLQSKWLIMIEKGFPFLKRNLFKENINEVKNLYKYKKLYLYISNRWIKIINNNMTRVIPKKIFKRNTSLLMGFFYMRLQKPINYFFKEKLKYIRISIRDNIAKLIKKFFRIFNIDILKYKRKLEYIYFNNIYKQRFNPKISVKKQKYIICYQYKISFGRFPNLKNPQSFNEKIQWLKLNYKNPLMTRLADKHLVKKYVSKLIGNKYIIPTLGVWNNAKEIDFSKLPRQFVLKTNWGSGQNIIVEDKTKINKNEIINKLNSWINIKQNHYFYSFEWCYKNIKPKIIAEKYIATNNQDLLDYKIMCYSGIAKNLFVCSERKTNLKVTFFDLNWNKLPFKRHYETSSVNLKKPSNLKEIIELSEKLSKPFPFARVDFYITNNKIYFGEITFYPGNGVEKFTPEIWDYKLGKYIILPTKNE